ncbi:bifunctional diguanylate cyclase/phosphodiesterase [Phreatobacter sp. AB_2022a]|uniref:bifunctional diguanylate cyclase/phosphodiesterase n=1 Tax=Phreatobacter sp. AB_2022a TaxID=3003134 RepID=UPI002286F708|nr:bifunctional diguanylate cyclase/phosphodiesterase [Phreatobacter sp. AB_2022a]MCZ0737667.1 PAS domain-containing protein [Phreatobacter sp. AB_2022a]
MPAPAEESDLLRGLVDHASVGMALLDADRRCLHANAAFARLVAREPAACVGLAPEDVIHPADRAGLGDPGAQHGVERRCIAGDGRVFHVLASLTPLAGQNGAGPSRILFELVDIEAQKRAELALARDEWRWHQALLAADQAVWDTDILAGQMWVSPQAKSILGLPAAEMTVGPDEWLAATHPDDRARLSQSVRDTIIGRVPVHDEVYRLRHADGHWVWIRSRGKVLKRGPNGESLRLVGTITDISAQKAMERRLQETSERLEIALAVGRIGIFSVDYPAGTRHWDARTYELHGVTPETFDATAEGFRRLVHPDDLDRVLAIREAALREGADYQFDYRVRVGPEGAIRHIRNSVRLIRGADGAIERGIGACWDISADVERARQLNDAVALLQAVMDGSPDLIMAKDLAGRYILANKATEAAIGLPAPEIIGRTAHDVLPAAVANSVAETESRVLATGQAETNELSAIVRGRLQIYSSTWAPRRDANGEVVGLIGVSRDVTAAKVAEAELRRSELRWQFAVEGAGDGLWDYDIASGHIFYSHRWKAMLGYADHEIGPTRNEWSDRVHPEDLPRCRAAIEAHYRGDAPDFALEMRMRAKDGTWRWMYGRGKVIERAPDGQPQRVVGTLADITARKRAEEAMLALNQRLQLAVEAAGAGIFELDFARSHFTWDARMYELYELAPGGFDGTLEQWLSFLHPDDVAEVLRRYDLAVEQTSLFSMDFRIRRQRSGTQRHVRSLARVIRDDAGAPVRAVGMNWDITDHKELAEALFEEKERLRITLHSIGDSVISTDAQARVTFMNPVAEAMTGWPAAEAVGKPLREVFRIVDEATGEPIADPVETCLARLQPFYLNEGAVLLARDGERRNVRDSAAPVRTASGEVIGAVLVFQDVTRARTLQQALEHQANHDSLTGLLNRTAFERALGSAGEAALASGRPHVLCFIDLDRFKLVNDSAGHAAGDALLRDVAGVLRRNCRAGDAAARLGGDEFGLLLGDCTPEKGEKIALALLRDLGAIGFVWDERPYQVGASVGLTVIGPPARRIDEWLSEADIACYTAKAAGRNQVAVYGGAGSAAHRNHRQVQVAAGIRHAIEADRFCLFAQEVVSLAAAPAGGRHFEILLRMLDENGNVVEPSAFIPASERFDLMGNIDRWVIRTTLRTHGDRLKAAADLSIAINLSANSLNDPFLWPYLQEELDASGLAPGRLHLEITETAVINNLTAARGFLGRARAAGCGVVLDDFGTGLSSFSYLRQFPVSSLKIDGGFIRQMADNEIDRAIVESINAVGHRLGAETVAEQVEDEATLELARAMGIDRAQGFAIARPRPFETIF